VNLLGSLKILLEQLQIALLVDHVQQMG